MRIAPFIIAAALAAPGIGHADDAAPASTAGWPTAIADRPYNLNAGMLELHGALPFASAEGSQTEVLLGVGASYGISDAIEIGADYALELRPSTEAAGVFAGHVLVRLIHNADISAAIGGSIFYSDSLSGSGLTLGTFGVAVRYRFNKQVSIFTDTNLCAGCVNIAGPVMGQGVVAYESGSNGSSSSTIVGFTLPVGIAYQATPQLYLSAATIVGAILLSPETDSALEFRDVIPVIASAWFSATPHLDLGASITDDLKNASDNYFFELGAKLTM